MELTEREQTKIDRLQEQFFQNYKDMLCPKVEHVDQWLKKYPADLVSKAMKYALQERAHNPIGFITYLLDNPYKISLLPDQPKPRPTSYSWKRLHERLEDAGTIPVQDQDGIHRLDLTMEDLDWALSISDFKKLSLEEKKRLFWIYMRKDKGNIWDSVSWAWTLTQHYRVMFQCFHSAALADWIQRSEGGQLLAESRTEKQMNKLTPASDIGSGFFLAPVSEVVEQMKGDR